VEHQTPPFEKRPSFDNPPIDIAGLPTLEAENFTPLDPRYLKVSLVGRAIFAALVVIAAVVAAVLVDEAWIPLVVMAGLLALIGVSSILRVL